jgi:hypothetical protein
MHARFNNGFRDIADEKYQNKLSPFYYNNIHQLHALNFIR